MKEVILLHKSTFTGRWLPIALCCVPGVLAAALIGVGIALGGVSFGEFLSGPLGFGLIVLALLTCPLSMGLMMRRASKPNVSSGKSIMMADCCLPKEEVSTMENDRLSVLRKRREALEREVADLQTVGEHRS